ncbi:hypothetical protein OAA60_03095 [Porticoccaceae bacterium]|nr:hypothetical protein [Porticoccaceae bacterium]
MVGDSGTDASYLLRRCLSALPSTERVSISRDNALCRMADMEDEKAINPEWNDEDEDHLSELKAALEKDYERTQNSTGERQ